MILNGGCGFAGCGYNYLVTTTFNSSGSNTQSSTVVAIVRSATYLEKGEVKKVLNENELGLLLK